MKNLQYWMIAMPSALAFVTLLYFLPHKKKTMEAQADSHSFDISTIEADALQKLKEPEKKQVINWTEDTSSNPLSLERLEEFWSHKDSLSNPLLAVYYAYRRLSRFPVENHLLLAQKARFINLLAFETQDVHLHNELLDWSSNLMTKASMFYPDNDSIRVDLAAIRLWYYDEKGRDMTPPMQSIAQIKSILAQNPKQTYAMYVLGMASLMSGQMEKAIEYFEKVIDIIPNEKNAIKALQSTYAQLGNKEKSDYWSKKLKQIK